MTQSTVVRILRILILAWLLVALSACRSKSDNGSARSKVLRIGYLPITDHLTVLAKARTTYQNVDFQPVRFGSWSDLSEALKTGSIEGAFVLSPIALELRSKGVPLKAVLLGHRNGSVVTVGRDSSIRTAADLAGKTVAIPNRFSTHNILLRKLLEKEQMKVEAVRVLEVPPPEMVNALATKRIDAFIVAEPFGAQAEVQGVGRTLSLSKDIWPDHICCVLAVHEQAILAERKAIEEVVASFIDFSHFIEQDPVAAANLAQSFFGQKSDIILRALTEPKGRVTYGNLTPSVADFAATLSALQQFGISNPSVELNAYVDDSFSRTAYARRASTP